MYYRLSQKKDFYEEFLEILLRVEDFLNKKMIISGKIIFFLLLLLSFNKYY